MLEDEDIHRAVNYIPRVTSSNVQKVETKKYKTIYTRRRKGIVSKSLAFCHGQSLYRSIRSGGSSTVISVNRDEMPKGRERVCNKIGETRKKCVRGPEEIQHADRGLLSASHHPAHLLHEASSPSNTRRVAIKITRRILFWKVLHGVGGRR